MIDRELHEQNRRSWNAVIAAHNSHKRDQAAFLRGGGTTLFYEERELLGELSGRTLLHLCCNAGQDTLSLARLGAAVTGVDISDEAIAFAQKLSEESAISAQFERADVYDWLSRATRWRHGFDRVFMSYGVLGWLSDLRELFAGIAGVLAPGGRLVLVESLANIVDAVASSGLRLETLREWMWSNGWKPFENMRAVDGRRWAMPEGTPQLPLMFGLVASKP
jgi:SAM-dependent methyltransferase